MAETLCIYHFPCADGFTAAWVVHSVFGDAVEYCPRNYDQPPPDVTGRDVIMVDFSYKRDVMLKMAYEANTILVLDHHASAARELEPFVMHGNGRLTPNDAPDVFEDLRLLSAPPILAEFDMQRSGARMAWDYFYPDEQPPEPLRHVEDRDLWRFALPGTKEIQAAVFSCDYTFATWTELMQRPTTELYQEGVAIDRKQRKDIDEFIGRLMRRVDIGGHRVRVMSIPYTMVSEAGHLMAQTEPFAACYWDTPDHRIFGLRSTADGIDVSKIAEQYGGGGHKHAAGFQVPRSHPLAQA